MHLEQIPGLAFGAVAIGADVAWAIALVRVPRFQTRDSAFLLAVVSLFGGPIAASIATPDYSPWTMAKLCLPFLAIGIYAIAMSSHRSRQVRSGAEQQRGEV